MRLEVLNVLCLSEHTQRSAIHSIHTVSLSALRLEVLNVLRRSDHTQRSAIHSTHTIHTVCMAYIHARWLGGVVVGCRTREPDVAGSTPTATLFGQQPWSSCSHLMCLCSPSSITWYLARAFMLKASYCGSGIGSNEQGKYCRVVLR